MKKKSLFLIICLFAAAAMASGAEHGGSHETAEIPWSDVAKQAVNLGILLVALFFFLKKSVVEFFSKRRESFFEEAQKTEKALAAAEGELKEIKTKISQLESSSVQAMNKAQTESEILKARMISDAEAQAKRMKDDVALIIGAEIYKAKSEIRNQIIEASVESAKSALQQSAETISQKSEKGFITDLGQVRT